MLISFSGCQSSGKTTLLKHLQEKNESDSNYKFVPEVTRLVKRLYNLPINERGTDLTQLLISSHHLQNCYNNISEQNSKLITILDRCSLDGLVYTHWLCEVAQTSLAAYTHSKQVYDFTKDHYDVIFYTSPVDVPIEEDGERSVNIEFRDRIIELFEDYMNHHTPPNIIRLQGTVQERLQTIKQTLETFNINIKI